MLRIRIVILLIGISLPYFVRIPGGSSWFHQYADLGLSGFLFFGLFNAIAWGSILYFTFLYKRKVLVIVPALFGFLPLAWVHSGYDLSSDPQASIGLLFIPIYALVPIAIGGAIGYLLDLYLKK